MLSFRNNRKDPDEEMSWWESITANVWASMVACIAIVAAIFIVAALVLPTQDLVAVAQANLITGIVIVIGVGSVIGLVVYVISYQHRIYAMLKLVNRRLRDGPQETLNFVSLDEETPEVENMPEPGIFVPATVEQPLVAGTEIALDEASEKPAAGGYAPLSVAADDASEDSQILQQLLAEFLDEDDKPNDPLGDTQEIIIHRGHNIVQSGIFPIEQQTADTKEIDTQGVREAMQRGGQSVQIPKETEDGDSLLFLSKGTVGLEDEDLTEIATDAMDEQSSATAEVEETSLEGVSDVTEETAETLEQPEDAANNSHRTTIVQITDHMSEGAALEAEKAAAKERRIKLEAKELGISFTSLKKILSMAHAEGYYDLPQYYRGIVDSQRRHKHKYREPEEVKKQA